MKKVLLSAIVFLTSVMIASAQVNAPKETPQLEFALQLQVTLGETYQVGDTQHGQRIVIPITGGTFEGPAIKGTIINGGADVRNRGIIWNGKDANGNPSFYFKAAPQFEAPADSKYAWLNNALFVCAPDFTQQFQGIVLNVWKVK